MSLFRPSANLAHLKTSETVAISTEAKRRKAAGEDVIDLGVGEPDFATPGVVAEAGIEAIRAGHTRYAPNVGIVELRRAMAGALSRMSADRPVDPDRLIISNGSKQSLFNACFTLFGPGDKVLIPSPAWVSYPQIVHLCRAQPVMVAGDPEWGLKVSVADLERQRDPAVRGLILCSPCNPTGAVYTTKELAAISEWAREHDLWVISDEIYRRIHYGPGPAPSLLDLDDAAFADPAVDIEVERMVAAFRRRRDYLVARFQEQAPGVEFIEPHGAFYLFVRVDGLADGGGPGGSAFAEGLMREEGVATVPGAAFGDDRWVRLSYSVSEDELERATDRVIRHLERCGAGAAS
jgi:aspartate aminotransferase